VSDALAGVRVLVTRPAEQARKLARMIETEGGEAILFSPLIIEPVADLERVRASIAPVTAFDIIIFVSPNAVAHGAALMGSGVRAGTRLAAVGPSTAAALENAGLRVAIRPAEGFTSEALLAEPALHALRDRRVLIVRGRGGRELLAETLTARGARVTYAEVYERKASGAGASVLCRRWRSDGIELVTALSVETLAALYVALGADAQDLLARSTLVTASARVLKRAAALGLESVLTANGPDDRALLEAMIAWQTGRSAASG
jgi:uroporphyrinogen-III synthase